MGHCSISPCHMSGLAKRQLCLAPPAVGRPRPLARSHAPCCRACCGTGRATVLVQCFGCRPCAVPPTPPPQPPLAAPPSPVPRASVAVCPAARRPLHVGQDRCRPHTAGIGCGCCHTPTAVTERVCASPHSNRRGRTLPPPPCLFASYTPVSLSLVARPPVWRLLLFCLPAPGLPLPVCPLVAAADRARTPSAPRGAPC